MSKQDLERRVAELEKRVEELENIVEGKAVISVPLDTPSMIPPKPWEQRIEAHRDYSH